MASTPILDVNQPFERIELQARTFDVDALHLEAEGGELVEKLRRSGWLWRGRGRYGPFASHEGFRTGVLPARSVALSHPQVLLPDWDATDPLNAFYTAVFGAPEQPASDGANGQASAEFSESVELDLDTLFGMPDAMRHSIGAIQLTRVGVSVARRHYLDDLNGLFVIRPDHAQDLIRFWNLRSFGNPIIPLPAEGPEDLLSFLSRGTLEGSETRRGGPNPHVERQVGVWGLRDASDLTRAAIDAIARRLQMTTFERRRDDAMHFMFPGLETRFEWSLRAQFAPNARSVSVRVPSVPLAADVHHVMPGTVAVDIELHDVSGLDPRLTAFLPPQRRLGALLDGTGTIHGADHIRVAAEGNGVVVGLPATSDEVAIGFVYNLDAIHALFDDEELKISQSEDGRFQTRAAEMLGGPFGGVMVQPGVRALIDKAARSNAGLAFQQLTSEVKKNHGAWPDKLTAFRVNVDDYAKQTVNSLLYSGLFVPMLDVHCSSCRVESQVSPRDLDTTMQCEFCGETFNLALSLSLSKSGWRYRLASHLGPEKVKALLPALATMSLLGQLSTISCRAMTHAFGVQFNFPRIHPIEADVVAYLGRPDWTLVLGEVKNGNRIDAKDVLNLEGLQQRLSNKAVRSILLFATLKDEWAPEEITVLRALVERATEVNTAFGTVTPRLPLVLTARDLSLPWDNDQHPSRWTQAGQDRIFAMAIESCKRNLGLIELKSAVAGSARPFECSWRDAESLGG